jgi:hypothetical protein
MKDEYRDSIQIGKRISLLVVALLILSAVYLFQRYNFMAIVLSLIGANGQSAHPYVYFVFNKSLRLILNDFACFLLIYVFFREQKYLHVAFYVALLEVLILLPLYFVLKLSLEGDSEISSPLLSQLHRLIINPMLMILLMIGFLYQRLLKKEITS